MARTTTAVPIRGDRDDVTCLHILARQEGRRLADLVSDAVVAMWGDRLDEIKNTGTKKKHIQSKVK